MNQFNQGIIVAGGILGSLLTLPVLANPEVNRVIGFSAPQNNPYNQVENSTLLGGDRTTPITQIPLPETVDVPVTTVIPNAGRVTVRLRNNTYAPISYQIIEHTNVRTLNGRSEVNLQNLPAPVTITLNRQDNGLLNITPRATQTQPGVLDVVLEESSGLSEDQTALRIQANGDVYLN